MSAVADNMDAPTIIAVASSSSPPAMPQQDQQDHQHHLQLNPHQNYAENPQKQQQQSRRNLGRAARRRRKKQLELETLELSLSRQQQQTNGVVHGASSTTTNTTRRSTSISSAVGSLHSRGLSTISPPSSNNNKNNNNNNNGDRHLTWPGILELRKQQKQLSAQDEIALLSQLGYVPGNAIGVVARVKDLPTRRCREPISISASSTKSCVGDESNTTGIQQGQQQQSVAPAQPQQKQQLKQELLLFPNDPPETPVVVQLYPLVLRNECEGGKTKGRKFKSRKRSNHTKKRPRLQKQQDDDDDDDKNNNDDDDDDDDENHSVVDSTRQSIKSGMEDSHRGNSCNGNTTRTNNQETAETGTGNKGPNPPGHDTQDAEEPSNNKSGEVVVEPFPTIYWLTHPLLRVWVSKLEVQGFGIQLEKRLQQDQPSLQRMYRAHEAYGHERIQLLSLLPTTTPSASSSYTHKASHEEHKSKGISPVDQDDDDDLGDRSGKQPLHTSNKNKNDDTNGNINNNQGESWWISTLGASRGISGIRNYGAIKCLHAHIAHYLSHGPGSQDNVVGQWILEALLLPPLVALGHCSGTHGDAADVVDPTADGPSQPQDGQHKGPAELPRTRKTISNKI